MANKQATIAAKHILEDRAGADYYEDTEILTDYLEGALGISKAMATQTAEEINTDRKGANYYADVEILTDFLAGRVGIEEAT